MIGHFELPAPEGGSHRNPSTLSEPVTSLYLVRAKLLVRCGCLSRTVTDRSLETGSVILIKTRH